MRNILDKICRGNQNTHHVFRPFFDNRPVCNIIRKNAAERRRPRKTIWRLCFECWITKVGHTHERTHMRARAHTHTHTHTHTLRIYKTRCFNAVTLFAGARFNVTLYAHCQSCHSYQQPSALQHVVTAYQTV